MEFPRYQVGQIVHIVRTPMDGWNGKEECEAGWADRMSQYCGEEATIIDSSFDRRGDRYYLDIDGRDFVWSPDCFQESYGEYVDTTEQDAAEIDAAMESLFEGFTLPHL